MIFLIIGLVLIAVIFFFLFFFPHGIKQAQETLPTGPKLSPVALQIVKEFSALPEASRPFGDIVNILTDVDNKHSVDAVERENHFNDNYLDIMDTSLSKYKFRWVKASHRACQHKDCMFSDYYRLHLAIEEVQTAVDAKERAVLESKHAANTDMLAELEADLRREAELNREFTTRFKELG